MAQAHYIQRVYAIINHLAYGCGHRRLFSLSKPDGTAKRKTFCYDWLLWGLLWRVVDEKINAFIMSTPNDSLKTFSF